MPLRAIWAIPLLLAVVVGAGCGAGDDVSEATSSSTTTGPGGVAGTVVRVSDVAGLDPPAVDRGVVVVVPTRLESSFWESLGRPASGVEPLAVASVEIDPAELPAGIGVVPVEPGGTFVVPDIEAGDILVCVADVAAGRPEGPPHRTEGCARATADQVAAGLVVQLGRGVRVKA